MTRTLLLIIAFVGIMMGSFIWFVATWDRDAEEQLSFILPNKLPPEGRVQPAPLVRGPHP